MKIYLKDIPPEGRIVDAEISPEIIEVTKKDIGAFTAPLKIQAKVERVQNTILANTTVQTHYHTLCYRCLKDIEKDLSQDLIFDFPVHGNMEFIDLKEDIRQEMILSMPARMLCKEDCKGICARCGVNLNQEECKCK